MSISLLNPVCPILVRWAVFHRKSQRLAPLILIPVLAIALIALWFGIRWVVQPLQSLEKKATELGWGNFDAIEEPVGGINEIQRLQAELIHMAQKVQLAQKVYGAIWEQSQLDRKMNDAAWRASCMTTPSNRSLP